MTVKLSEYDEALLREIGHFADTILAEQVRAVMIARNNAEQKHAHCQAQLARLEKTNAGDHRGFVESRRSICEQSDRYKAQIEAVETLQRIYERTADVDPTGEFRKRAVDIAAALSRGVA